MKTHSLFLMGKFTLESHRFDIHKVSQKYNICVKQGSTVFDVAKFTVHSF
jgi:hypothetical protein